MRSLHFTVEIFLKSKAPKWNVWRKWWTLKRYLWLQDHGASGHSLQKISYLTSLSKNCVIKLCIALKNATTFLHFLLCCQIGFHLQSIVFRKAFHFEDKWDYFCLLLSLKVRSNFLNRPARSVFSTPMSPFQYIKKINAFRD